LKPISQGQQIIEPSTLPLDFLTKAHLAYFLFVMRPASEVITQTDFENEKRKELVVENYWRTKRVMRAFDIWQMNWYRPDIDLQMDEKRLAAIQTEGKKKPYNEENAHQQEELKDLSKIFDSEKLNAAFAMPQTKHLEEITEYTDPIGIAEQLNIYVEESRIRQNISNNCGDFLINKIREMIVYGKKLYVHTTSSEAAPAVFFVKNGLQGRLGTFLQGLFTLEQDCETFFNSDTKFMLKDGTMRMPDGTKQTSILQKESVPLLTLLNTEMSKLLATVEQIQRTLNPALQKNLKKENVILFSAMAPYLEQCIQIIKKLKDAIAH